MPKSGEFPVAQNIAEQLLAGSNPGNIVSWQMPAPDHSSGSHPHGGHMGVAYMRGDGSVYSTVMPDQGYYNH